MRDATIVVAAADERFREALARALQEAGFDVRLAAREARRALEGATSRWRSSTRRSEAVDAADAVLKNARKDYRAAMAKARSDYRAAID